LIGPPETLVRELQTFLDHGGPGPDALSDAKLGRLPKPRLSKIAHSEPVMRARCPACRTTGDVDLRTLDWHHGAAVTALTPALSCRACRPNAPFAELLSLSKSSLAEEYYAERSGNRWVSE
jgi:hypothetical protein